MFVDKGECGSSRVRDAAGDGQARGRGQEPGGGANCRERRVSCIFWVLRRGEVARDPEGSRAASTTASVFAFECLRAHPRLLLVRKRSHTAIQADAVRY